MSTQMERRDVRVGFVGCGEHATAVLLPAVQEIGVDLAALCDLDRRRAQRAARRFGGFRAYQDLHSMIDEMDLDAVLVCGPPEMHAEAATAALRRGCHVWTEAPPAPTSGEAQRLSELAAESGLVFHVGLTMRFAPAYERLGAVLAEQIGEVASFEVSLHARRLPDHDEPLLFEPLHALDLVRHLLGPVDRLSAQWGGRQGALMVAVALRLASGAVGTVSLAAPVGCPTERVSVTGAGGTATVEERMSVVVRRTDEAETSVWRPDGRGLEAGGSSGRLRGYLPVLERFADAVAGVGEPTATISEAADSMRLVDRLAGTREE